MKKKILIGMTVMGIIILVACRKEIVRVFEVQTQQISNTLIIKQSVKAEMEFISMAYSDMFGKTIPASTLNNTLLCYSGTNDKALVTDRIIRSYLNNPGANIPSAREMTDDLSGFITNTYQRFYHRNPEPMEVYQWGEMIKKDPSITPSTIYYSFLTSTEYRYK